MIIPPTDPRAIQRSPEWFAWRRGDDLGDGPRITASEIGIILGISPYKTAHRLWLEKTGQADPPPPNWGQQRGIDLEDTARLAYVRKTGNLVEPVCVQHDLFPEFAASLDGLTVFGDVVLEIKVPGAEDHGKAVIGVLPDHYFPQVQWQLFCSGAQKAHYWSFREGRGVLVEVAPELEYWEQTLVPAARAFRLCCLERKPPAGDAWVEAAARWRQAKIDLDLVRAVLEEMECELKGLMPVDRDRHEGGGVLATRVSKTGSVDYRKALTHLVQAGQLSIALELQGVPKAVVEQAMQMACVDEAFLDAFRKPGGEYIKFTPREDDPIKISNPNRKKILVDEASSFDF